MLIVVGLLIAFVIVALTVRPGTRGCRWRADRRLDDATGRFYRCAACGAETRTMTGKPPKSCLRDG